MEDGIENPTNRELSIMLRNLSVKSEAWHHDALVILNELRTGGQKTLEQAMKTNGRVNRHDWQFKAAWWGLGALWAILIFGMPIIWSYMKLEIKSIADDSSQTAISQLEDKYDFKNAK